MEHKPDISMRRADMSWVLTVHTMTYTMNQLEGQ